MSDEKQQEELFNDLIGKLHKSTEGLAKTIAKTPFGDANIAQTVEEFQDDYGVPQNELDADFIRESNRQNVFHITNNRGRIVVLDVNRARARVKNKLSNWRQSLENGTVTVNGIAIPVKEKTQRKIEKLLNKASDGDLEFPIKFKTSTGMISVDMDTLLQIDNAIQEFLDNCNRREQEIIDQIDSAYSTDEIAEILVANRILL